MTKLFVSAWPRLRVLLQLCVAAAMMSQREGVALMIAGLAMVLEMIQDRSVTPPSSGGANQSERPVPTVIGSRL
jgi:hypothetical protein